MNSQNSKMVMMQKIFNPRQYRLNNSLGTLDRNNYIRVMRESVIKALSPDETPVKEKHVRRLLIASFQFESHNFFWQNIPEIRLKEHQFVCWKFCHVLHKMIRDGHNVMWVSSVEKKELLLQCGNLWRLLGSGNGPLIHAYCVLIYERITFLQKNPIIPPDLRITDEKLYDWQQKDTSGDLTFDFTCELFDSIQHILTLQSLVLDEVAKRRLNSIANPAKCLLSPLVACIQDSTMLYDITVKLLFKLHANLSMDVLSGHRSRFNEIHKNLEKFYERTRSLQYFRTLIQIPNLNARPPNFLIANELKQHVAPQVIMISDEQSASPERTETLVNLDEDDDETLSHVDDLDSNPSINFIQQNHNYQSFGSEESQKGDNHSADTIFNQSENDPFAPQSSSLTPPIQRSLEEVRGLHEQIKQLELSVSELREELSRERSEHENTKHNFKSETEQLQSELSKVRSEVNSMKYQMVSSRKEYDKLMEECERAKHDNDISQMAMRKMVKEMGELKIKQLDELQQVRDGASKEADAREEDLLMAEMNETDKVIREATRKIEELSEKSRKVESGVKLQVNEKISEVCTNLMKAVRNLIAQARLLQREIVSTEGKGTNQEEFYKRNSSWTEGLISAANVVAMAARSLVDAADRSMSNQARFSELAAAAHEVAAATTQLVVASQVKANKDSDKLKMLLSAAKQVRQCTNNVVEASRVCAELVEQEVDKFDISTLSLHQTKKLEMETQVRLLELEESLTKERAKLGLLRRKHYEEEEAQAKSAADANSGTL